MAYFQGQETKATAPAQPSPVTNPSSMSWRKFLFPWLRDREIIAENNFMPIDLGLNVKGSVLAVGYFTAGKDSERK